MIRCFLEGLKPSVQTQMDTQSRDLSSWEETVEKAVNAEAKMMLQSFSITHDMDLRCPRGNKPARKEEKDSGAKNKSTDSASADTSSGKETSSTQQATFAHPKKNHRGGPRRGRERGPDSPAMGVNAIPKKEENLPQVECFHCRKKGNFTNRCPQKKK